MGAGNGRREIVKENSNDKDKIYLSEFLQKIPDDQYLCRKCSNVPEIKKIDFNNYEIEIYCKDHGRKILPIKEYITEQSKFHYYNLVCDGDKSLQRDNINEIFNYCVMCKKNLCKKCSNKDDKTHKSCHYKVNQLSSLDENNHYKTYSNYCEQCNLQLSSNKCRADKSHTIIRIKPAEKDDIQFLEKKINDITKKMENLDNLKKLLNIVVTTQKEHKFNYYHNANISNIVNSLKKDEEEDIQTKYQNKMKNNEKKLLEYLNIKLQLDLKGDEIRLDLNNQDISPNDLTLFSLIEFPNLETINLSNNELSDINLIKNFDLSKIKAIDLSYNKIKDLSPLKDISNTAQKLEKLFLNNNNITNADILKKQYFKKLKEVRLTNNKLSEEDIKEIYGLINEREYSDSFLISYRINTEEFMTEKKIRIFGESFVRNNKKKCKIVINNSGIDNEMELTDSYKYKDGEKELIIKFIKTGYITDMSYMFAKCTSLVDLLDISNFNMSDVENMSCMFYGCVNLKELDDISKWNTSNVKYMQKMFCNCKSLSKLPPIENWNTEKVENREGMFENKRIEK